MFSSTTMASSMTRPIATDRAPRVRMLRVIPSRFIRMKATSSERGIETPETRVPRKLRRKTRIMRTARIPPITASRVISLTEFWISGAWLITSVTVIPAGTVTVSMASDTASTVSTVFSP